MESFGKVVDVREDPGLFCYPRACCTKFHKVSTRVQTLAIRGQSVPDSDGAPLNISAIMNFIVVDAVAYTYSVESALTYIANQTLEVLKLVCGKFPYHSSGQESIVGDTKLIGNCMRDLVQD